MISSLAALVRWCSTSAPMVFVRDSRFGMPAVQSVHLVGITVFLAAIIVLDMRLAGIGMVNESLLWLERQLTPWIVGGVTLVVLSGVIIFLGTPSKYAQSNPFRIKMAVLGLAIVFHFGVVRRFVTADRGSPARRGQRLVAGLSVTLWFLVGWAGRAIAFVP
ncbi:MAG TPA: DUF6644 family protein [Vicinamibacterales bacterium]|nr:DUF6644 family protein [Vicinamibacterales bacterium]